MAEIPTAHAVEDIERGPMDITDNMKTCYSLSITVKWLTFIDFIFSILYAFGNLYFSIPLLMSAIGYIGARKFYKKYILCYYLYIIIINIIRCIVFMNFFYGLPEDTENIYLFDYTLVVLCTILEFWIAHIIYKFYRFLVLLSDSEIIYLRMIESLQGYYLILW